MIVAFAAMGNDLNAPLDHRFGRAQNFVLVELDTGQVVSVISNPNVAAPGGAGVSTAQMLVNNGVGAVVAGAFGPNAINILRSAGVATYSSAGYSTVGEAIDALRTGKLPPAITPSGGRGFGHGRRW